MMLVPDDNGLYCPAGDFHIDPWGPVSRAVITHAHSDHARPGSQAYLCAEPCRTPLELRMGERASIQTLSYGERLNLGRAVVSLHPAGHVLGSAQVRIEVGGEVWVVSGDYKRHADPTCTPFEPVRCHTFVTESTFGLPIYRWQGPDSIVEEMVSWWQANAEAGRPSVLTATILGKAQRVLACLSGREKDIGPVYAHGAMQQMNRAYRMAGVELPKAPNPVQTPGQTDFARALILAPPSALSTPWMRRFKNAVTARASGWMRVRGRRRRLALDRGFVFSDHTDWPGLLQTVAETGAERVLATHGSGTTLARYLRDRDLEAQALALGFWDETEEGER
jgi:putative mRNA 3-end processing factor